MDGSVMLHGMTKDASTTLAASDETRPVVVEWLLDPQDDARFDVASCAMCGCGCS